MSNPNEPGTLVHHLERLAADAEDVASLLQLPHADGGDIHPEAVAKAAKLKTNLREVVHALTHHEHLAMDTDDVWAALTLKHEGDDGIIG